MDKYLTDGRKVAVLGKLNNNETIVQEIFVTADGTEIPSGENFVVKSLHDSPVISWKEKNLLKITREIKVCEDIKRQAEIEERESLEKLRAIKVMLMSSINLCSNLEKEKAEILTSFITGNIEYLVLDSYEITPPVKLMDEIIEWRNGFGVREFDSLKLLSVMGGSKGDLKYKINQYSDGSGSSYNVYPFLNKEDAIAKIKELAERMIENNRLSNSSFNVCKDLGIEFSTNYVKKYVDNLNARTIKELERLQKEKESKEKLIDELNSLLISSKELYDEKANI